MVDTCSADDVYPSKTINPSSMARYKHLPAFPTIDSTLREGHLLANVPRKDDHASSPCSLCIFSRLILVARLSAREVDQRRHAGSTAHALQRLSEYSYRGEFSISESDTEALAARLHVDKSIIVYNARRFRAYVFFLTDLRGWWRRQVFDNERQTLAESPINSQQVTIILEFFLQMDGRCASPIFDVRPSFSLQSMFST